MRSLRGQVAIVGVGETGYLKRGSDETGPLTLTARAVLAACADAGMDPREVDGFASYADDATSGSHLATALGVRELRWSSMVSGGGGGGSAAAVLQAAAAIASGQADCVAVYRGLSQQAEGRQPYVRGHLSAHYTAHGILTPVQVCALRIQRMLEVDKVPASALEALALVSYLHAQRNPRAVAYGTPLDAESYRTSRLISDPLRLFDCSRENDGAAALLLVPAERAGEYAGRPAYLLGGVAGSARGWGELTDNEDDYTSAGFSPPLVERLWESAGVGPRDVDVVQAYENFSGSAVAALIDLGLVPPGPAAADVLNVENLSAPSGGLPLNTAGGNLAEGFVHGIGMTVEAVRQLRGGSPNPVPGAEVSLLIGGPMAPLVSALVLGSAATR
ncbi:MAG: thiolase C-terminal domain-containing protein [Sporichthyaceae bacterium]